MENVSFSTGFFTAMPSTPIATAHLEVPHAVILCTVLGVASVVGTFGNMLVLLSVIRFENLKAIPDLFIFSLSLSDILVTALYQPLKMYRYTNLQETNEAYLGTSSFLGYLSLVASITNVFGVTVERLVSIRFPLKYGRFVTRRRAIVTIICIWTFSVINGAIGSRRHACSSKYTFSCTLFYQLPEQCQFTSTFLSSLSVWRRPQWLQCKIGQAVVSNTKQQKQ